MSKRKIIVPIEDQITDFFTDAPQGAVETLLRVCTRIVGKRFPPVVDPKLASNGKGKVGKKSTTVARGTGVSGFGVSRTGATPPALDLSNVGPAKESSDGPNS